MTWKQLTERDCREWKLLAINPHDRHTWRSGVRFAIRAASQLPLRGPTDVDLPLYLHFNKKSDENATFEKKENYHRFWLKKKKDKIIYCINLKYSDILNRYHTHP